jgi:hypothetical protein
MTSKHPKLDRPTDVDLMRNPLIGGSKGVTMAQASLDDLEELELEGANTIEGDIENDTNAQGGLDKAEVMNRREAPPRADHAGPARSARPMGRTSHGRQLKTREGKPDVEDARLVEHQIARDQQDD